MVKFLFTGACAPLGVWLLITGVIVFRVQAQRLRSRDAGVPVTCRDGYMEVAVTPSEFGGTTITFNIRGSNPRDCQVAENEKLSCGDRFVNETACTETGCCFDRNAPVACYYSNSEQSYGSYYTSLDYPVTYVLREPVYVEVRILERTDTNIVLTLDDCWATSTPSPLGKPQWNLLVDGCSYRDDNYLTSLVPVDAATSRLPNPTHYKRFVLKMFTFVDPASRRALKEMIYIHCSAAVCYPSVLDSCVKRCIAKRHARDAPLQTVRKEASSKQTAVASSGAVILTAPDARALESWDSEGEDLQGNWLDATSIAFKCRYNIRSDMTDHVSVFQVYYDGCYVRQQNNKYMLSALVEAVDPSDRIMIIKKTPMECPYLNVQCTRDGYMMTAISKAVTKPDLLLNSVSLIGGRNPPCAPVGRSASFLLFKFPLGACGTRLRLADDKVVYENEMSGTIDVLDSRYGSITRDADYKLTIRCLYSAKMALPLQVQIQSVDPPRPVAEQGPLRIELRIARDKAYGSYFADLEYPLVRVLRELVYVEVRLLGRTDPKIHLVLDDCWATSTTSPLSEPRWSLLVDGLLLQCRYAGNKSVPLQAVVYTIAPPPPVVAQGPLRVELRIAREQSYGSYYTSLDYPVTYVHREPVYVEVRILERTDTNIVLTLDDCWATSTPSPLGKPQWNLLVDGCSYRDDNYLTSLVPVDAATSRLPNPTHYKRFVLKMFTFVDPASRRALKEMIYIHCSAAVCYPSVLDSCVKRCIAKRHARDAPLQTVRKEASSKQTAVASSGAVILTAPDARALESWDSEGEVPQSLGYGLMGVAASVVLVVFVLVPVAVWRLKPRVEETKL
ncbi:UNVERIFIED_CONTAM: hypothetical protein FKN15_011875 [Acipenser sinensis]